MKNLELVSKYPEIFTTISKWKTLELKDLYEISEFDRTYSYFKRIIRDMQKSKLLDSIKFGSRGVSKIVFSNREVIKSLDSNLDYQINYTTIMHDAIVAKVLFTLKQQGYIENFKLPHEYYLVENFYIDLNRVEPDAIFYDASGTVYLLEVELTQKDFTRYKRKWSQLSLHDENFFVIYLVPSLSLEKSLNKNIERFCGALKTDQKTISKIKERILVVPFKDLVSLRGYEAISKTMSFLKRNNNE